MRKFLFLNSAQRFSDFALLLMRLFVGLFLIFGVWDNITDGARLQEFAAWMLGGPLDQLRKLLAREVEVVVHDRLLDVDFDERQVVGDLLLLGHARDFGGDRLLARARFRVVELLDEEHEHGGVFEQLGSHVSCLLARVELGLRDPLVDPVRVAWLHAGFEQEFLGTIRLDGVQISSPFEVARLALRVRRTGCEEALEMLTACGDPQ